MSDLVGPSSVARLSPEDGFSQALVAVVGADDPEKEGRSPTLRIAQAAEQAYRSLVPGGLLVIPSLERRAGTRVRKSKPVVDDLGLALFRAGFIDTRFVSSAGGELTVLARRGIDPPPTQRAQVLSVVLPAFNEKATFATVMDALLSKSIPEVEIEVVVVEAIQPMGLARSP